MNFEDFLKSAPHVSSNDISDRAAEIAEYERKMDYIRYRNNIMYLYQMYYTFYDGLLTKYSYLPKIKIDNMIRPMALYCMEWCTGVRAYNNTLAITVPSYTWDHLYKEYCIPADIYRNIFLTLPHRKELIPDLSLI